MSLLVVGFDSAWTPKKSGAIAGVLMDDNSSVRGLGPPLAANFQQAQNTIIGWQAEHEPVASVILIDQPIVVRNASGQRPVENIVSSAVSLRHGGVQPAHTGRVNMFCENAPVWRFLAQFGGPADPLATGAGTLVFESYPVLAIIALGWTLPDAQRGSRLPKYNPGNRGTFSIFDWQHICRSCSAALQQHGAEEIAAWLERQEKNPTPAKRIKIAWTPRYVS